MLCTISAFCEGAFSDFDKFQKTLSREEVEERIKVYLQKDAHVSNYITIDDRYLTLYDGPVSQSDRRVEYKLEFAKENKNSKAIKKRKNLIGVKIAIDPGHFGGPYSRLEARYIDIPPSLERASTIQFDEGTLSFLTAQYLKILLEREGAHVFLTRDKIGKGVFHEDFFEWLKKSPEFWNSKEPLCQLFRKHYNVLDLRARAEKINGFGPDLSIIIHYNSHHVGESDSSNNAVTPCNYNMVFIPGAFCRNELVLEEARYEFLRMLVTSDLPHSAQLSSAVLKKFHEHLCVPVVCKEDGARYLDSSCLKVNEGVYARNLAMTRLVHGPICYGETLIQNNIDECINLSREDFFIGGRQCSSRVKQVAEAYFEGIKSYLLD